MKIGLIAGGGDLPVNVVLGARQTGHDVFVAAIDGFSAPDDFDASSSVFGLAEFGKMTRAFKCFGCTHICFAGNVARPDFKNLRPDLKGLKHLPGAVKAAAEGDDSLLAFLLSIFEKEGFEIISPQELCADLLLPAGHLGQVKLIASYRQDAEKACKMASAVGALDIGQGAVVCRGLVLAVEAQEGTDEMLRRVAKLDPDIRGRTGQREGVLAKMVKPNQEKRVDLPTIGLTTVELAAAAGLAGIVAESGLAFILDRDNVIKAADQAGLFLVGLPPRS